MYIDVNLRARAAHTLLDAISVLDLKDHGTEDADNRALLALEQLGLPPLDTSPELAATMAATTDLLWSLTLLVSRFRGEARETTIANLREVLVTQVYPDADLA